MSFDSYHQPEPMTSLKLTDSLVEETLLDRIEALEQRITALENKQPGYVPPPVYGPITYQCPHCGVMLHGSKYHVCGDFTHLILDDQTQEIK